MTADELPDLWNLSHPDRVEAVARAYVEAGSRVILTNTFRSNRVVLERHADQPDVVAVKPRWSRGLPAALPAIVPSSSPPSGLAASSC